MREPMIVPFGGEQAPISLLGESFSIQEWRGSGPRYQHIHQADDEAWQVMEGTLRFSFGEKTIDAGPGSFVFVPAGVAHTYKVVGSARYLIILTPRLRDLIAELQSTALAQHGAVMRKYQSQLIV